MKVHKIVIGLTFTPKTKKLPHCMEEFLPNLL